MCLDDIFSSGEDRIKTQTLTSTSGPPAWIQDAGKSLYQDKAQPLADRPYPTYSGDRIAGFTPDQLAAFDLTRSTTGAYGPDLADARSRGATAAAPFDPSQLTPYISSYIDATLDPTLKRVQDVYARYGTQADAAAAQRGSYWNDRTGVTHGLLARDEATDTASIVGKAYQDAWNAALLEAITDGTAVVTLPTVHWTDGTRFDLAAVGRRCRDVGAALVVDWGPMLVALLAERAATTDWLHAEVAQRDETIAWLHREVADRDRTVTWLHSEVADRDRTIGELRGGATRP